MTEWRGNFSEEDFAAERQPDLGLNVSSAGRDIDTRCRARLLPEPRSAVGS
jgi:hypothetical protein